MTFYDDKRVLDMSNFVASPEWRVISTKAVFTEKTYPCCVEPYPDISFYIVVARQSAFYNYILILPCFLLSCLTLLLFWLPPETPAKMVLGMNIFIAFFLLLLLLEDFIPSASSDFPLIGTYYCINMIVITLSMFLCLFVVNFHFRGDNRKEVPYWLKYISNQKPLSFLDCGLPNPKSDKGEDKNYAFTAPVHQNIPKSAPDTQCRSIPTTSKLPRQFCAKYEFEQTTEDSCSCRYCSDSDCECIPGTSSSLLNNVRWNVMPNTLQPSTYNCVSYTHSEIEDSSSTPPYPPDPSDYSEPASSLALDSSNIPNLFRRRNIHPPLTKLNLRNDTIFERQNQPKTSSHTAENVSNTTHVDLEALHWQRRIKNISIDILHIYRTIDWIQKMHLAEENTQRIAAEWQCVGVLFDRIFFCCYLVGTILTSIFFFPRSGREVFKTGPPQNLSIP